MTVPRLLVMLQIALICAAGCRGKLDPVADTGAPDGGNVGDAGTTPDAAPGRDMPDPEPDVMMPDPLCVGVTCLPNSECHAGACYCAPGFMGDPLVGCQPGNPCDGASCAFGATCRDDGMCACDAGFDSDMLGGCVSQDPGFPDERSELEVCGRWNSDYPARAVQKWQVSPIDSCDGGILDPEFVLDGVRRVTLYRWLAGLPAVTTKVDYGPLTQSCASALAAEGIGVRPEITSDFQCYSPQAAEGALSSNITRGPTSPAEAVDDFMIDEGVESLGHRRWILNPEMGATAFGQRGTYSCMYAVDTNGSSNPLWVAFPFGTFPRQALLGPWTFATDKFSITNAAVAITDSSGGAVATENVRVVPGTFGLPTLAWEVPAAAPGNLYTVTISNLLGDETEVTYPVNVVDCPPAP